MKRRLIHASAKSGEEDSTVSLGINFVRYHLTMLSPTSQILTRFDFNLDAGATTTVVNTDELILMILEALHEPVDTKVQCIGENEKNYRKCMLVNRKWCKWAQRLLWKDLSLPQQAFDAVIQQFDVMSKGDHYAKLDVSFILTYS